MSGLGAPARTATPIPERALLNTGDTIQGSAEVLFTRGQAIADVVDQFKIDYFAPGNWDFVYGSQRFLELFGGNKARWGAIFANLYYDGEPFAEVALHGRDRDHVVPVILQRIDVSAALDEGTDGLVVGAEGRDVQWRSARRVAYVGVDLVGDELSDISSVASGCSFVKSTVSRALA